MFLISTFWYMLNAWGKSWLRLFLSKMFSRFDFYWTCWVRQGALMPSSRAVWETWSWPSVACSRSNLQFEIWDMISRYDMLLVLSCWISRHSIVDIPHDSPYLMVVVPAISHANTNHFAIACLLFWHERWHHTRTLKPTCHTVVNSHNFIRRSCKDHPGHSSCVSSSISHPGCGHSISGTEDTGEISWNPRWALSSVQLRF